MVGIAEREGAKLGDALGLGVGSMDTVGRAVVGKGVGAFEGLGVGRNVVGVPVGTNVLGAFVGAFVVGLALGCLVGDRVGTIVGCSVGCSVGFGEGRGVGEPVGCSVGFGEGCAVGEPVGMAVVGCGDTVGANVGASVGLIVQVPQGISHAQGQALIMVCTCCSFKPIASSFSHSSNWKLSQGSRRASARNPGSSRQLLSSHPGLGHSLSPTSTLLCPRVRVDRAFWRFSSSIVAGSIIGRDEEQL